jgi:hypothetical protein
MHEKIINELLSLREELSILSDKYGESILHITNSNDLQNDIQINVINFLNEANDEIDTIVEDIENGEYDEDDQEFDDE